MAWQRVPLPKSDQTLIRMTPTLDGASYGFTFDWNSRVDRWSLRISDIDGNVLVAGIKLVPMFPLLRNVSADNRPKGEMFILTADNGEITRESIDDAVMYYVPEEDLA